MAGERLGDLKKVGPFLVAFGVLLPILHGFFGAWLGHLAGLSLGGCTVFAAIVSSASYIAAPPAVRLTLPEANPTLRSPPPWRSRSRSTSRSAFRCIIRWRRCWCAY